MTKLTLKDDVTALNLFLVLFLILVLVTFLVHFLVAFLVHFLALFLFICRKLQLDQSITIDRNRLR